MLSDNICDIAAVILLQVPEILLRIYTGIPRASQEFLLHVAYGLEFPISVTIPSSNATQHSMSAQLPTISSSHDDSDQGRCNQNNDQDPLPINPRSPIFVPEP